MQSGAIAASPAAGEIVVEAIDVIRKILRSLATSGAEPTGNDSDLLARLKVGPAVPSAPKPEPAPAAAPAEDKTPEPLLQSDPKIWAPSNSPKVDAAPPANLPAVTSNVSLPLERLESLADLVGQLVQTRNNLTYLMRDRDDAELEESVQRLSYITSDLGNGIVATRRQAHSATQRA
jgi:hypothetical protein